MSRRERDEGFLDCSFMALVSEPGVWRRRTSAYGFNAIQFLIYRTSARIISRGIFQRNGFESSPVAWRLRIESRSVQLIRSTVGSLALLFQSRWGKNWMCSFLSVSDPKHRKQRDRSLCYSTGRRHEQHLLFCISAKILLGEDGGKMLTAASPPVTGLQTRPCHCYIYKKTRSSFLLVPYVKCHTLSHKKF